MKIIITQEGDRSIAEVISDGIEIKDAQSALEIIMNCAYQGAESIIVHEKNIVPGFFDLTTGVAGDVLQKVSTYRVRMAVVCEFSKYPGRSLRDFIYESNKGNRVFFTESVASAKEKLAGAQ